MTIPPERLCQQARILAMLLVIGGLACPGWAAARNADATPAIVKITSLNACLQLALAQNPQRQISRYALEIAEAQQQQAFSAYWPQLKAVLSASRRDEDWNFLFPQETSTYRISGMAPVPLDVTVNVPEKYVKQMDRDVFASSLNLRYPLYTGGKRAALATQAELGVKIAQETVRRTELQLIYDVKRMYWGAILAANLDALAQTTQERFQALLTLTERLYQTGSGSVKKTDYLRLKVMVATVQSIKALLAADAELAKTALSNSLGLAGETEIVLTEDQLPVVPLKGNFHALLADAYRFNPNWAQLELALKAAAARMKEAQSGHWPLVALTGELTHLESPYAAGLMTDQNRNSWTFGLAVEIPLFQGFRTSQEVREAQARLEQLKQEQFVLREGLALQVKQSVLQLDRAQEQMNALQTALDAARENRELNEEAYQAELVDLKEVIEAQIMEVLVRGQYVRAQYDQSVNQAQLDLLIGQELMLPR